MIGAGEQAAHVLSLVDLKAIKHVANDEMFSQVRPVFTGIDMESQYLFKLSLHETRNGEEVRAAIREIVELVDGEPFRVQQTVYAVAMVLDHRHRASTTL